ncbi:putative 2-dehydropantoate 2-reductase [Taphrina deformans PYCC 5710]|uniref:2-dehydropantoate 2-reductase n=1 Tax=Taphrina deformans (strain PYCC 5710 / ATCC 11124 / CBS 356.35 / IMI 108563 / JCM 9778 / NBRC 8474) TaxID=1097556 RepID=R4XCV1_TAPDE|nr:putative 2-dehydropantoate 2-reductase [Taphrina deformans PYCC 5710]|eukprot:CCG81150.1 putative 2-dehydropantoate 2-reductase [Taphrina deformans PYCC 5710]
MNTMEPREEHSNKLRILSIGSNAISAFFSWRLQASQAADITIVWRSHFEAVTQYGISFRSDIYGPDRFRPNRVVRNVDEAAENSAGYDYVFVCIKALPDIYKLGEVIKPVVTPSHTCIIVNTTTALDIEAELMELYPRNMVLSLCAGIDLIQTGPADFDHIATNSVQIGALRANPTLPREAQEDMTESLTLTLEAGALECTTTNNIEKYQWERLIGLIAFHPISVILKEPNHAKLMDDPNTKALISDIFDECIRICEVRKITFPYDFKSKVMQSMITTKEAKSTMYQDFLAGRPLEIEIYLTTPIRFARDAQIDAPHMRSVHALLSHINRINQQKPASPLPNAASRLAPQHTGQSVLTQSRPYMHRGLTDGATMQNSGRAMSMVYGAPPTTNGYARAPVPPPQSRRAPSAQITRSESLEGLEEFAAVAMYSDLVPNNEVYPSTARSHSALPGVANDYSGRQQNRPPSRASTSQGYYPTTAQGNQRPPRQNAFAMMGRKMSNLRASGRGKTGDFDDDDDDDDAYIESPVADRGPPIDPEKVDMLAMTRRGRNSALGNRLEADRMGSLANGRPKPRQTKTSDALMHDIPGVHDAVTNSALFGMGDNRYGTVDSRTLAKSANVRLNSMQSVRAPSMTQAHHAYSVQQQRQPGPPNAMNGRGPYTNDMQYQNRARVTSGSSTATFRGQIPPQAVQRQQILSQAAEYPVKGMDRNTPAGARSVTGSASASFGSLGNGSGSHSSSSSRDEIPPPPPVAR